MLKDAMLEKVQTLDNQIKIDTATRDILLDILENNTPVSKRKYKARKAAPVTEADLPNKADMPTPACGVLRPQELLDALQSAGKEGATVPALATLVNMRRPKDKVKKVTLSNALSKLVKKEPGVRRKPAGSHTTGYLYFYSSDEEQTPAGTYRKVIKTPARFEIKVVEKLIKKTGKAGITYAEVLAFLDKKSPEDVCRQTVGRFLKDLVAQPGNYIKKRKTGKKNNFGNPIYQYYHKLPAGALI
jgi:hypothetical protein